MTLAQLRKKLATKFNLTAAQARQLASDSEERLDLADEENAGLWTEEEIYDHAVIMMENETWQIVTNLRE